MAINRAPFNALVDDDGTGLTGSVWNKGAIAGVVLDPVDAALALGTKSVVINSTTTGVQNAWAPGIADDTVILWTGAADLTLNGLAGAAAGRRVTIKNLGGGGLIFLPHQSGSAAANCALYNVVGSGATPIAALGSVTYVSRGDLWVLVAHEQGNYIDIPFSAANFSTNGSMTWSVTAGQALANRYRVSGRTLLWQFAALNTTLGGTPASQMRVVIPNGYTSLSGKGTGQLAGNVAINNGGAWSVGQLQVSFNDFTHLEIMRGDFVNYVAGNTHVNALAMFEIT